MSHISYITFVICVINVLVISGANGSNITFKATPTSKHPMNFDLLCNYTLNARKEFFASFSIFKDNKLFYHFDNKTKHNPIFTKVHGINRIFNKGPGHFAINNANKSTSGTYECFVYFNKHKGWYSKKLKIAITDDVRHPMPPQYLKQRFTEQQPKVKLNIMPKVFKVNGSISVHCETKLVVGKQSLVSLSLTKDKHAFAIINMFGQRSFDKTQGVRNITWLQSSTQPPIVHVKIGNATRLTSGMYRCELTYRNTTSGLSFNSYSNYMVLRNAGTSVILSFTILFASIFTIIINQFYN